MAGAAVHEDLAAFDEEEPEIRGNLVFRPPVEVLPQTKRTEELQKKKLEDLQRKKEAVEKHRKEKEREEMIKRQADKKAKKQKEEQEKARKERERKKQEEEEQRKKMEGGLDQIIGACLRNSSAPHITLCGIELNEARVRLLTQALVPNDQNPNPDGNTSCMSLDLNRKGLGDADGISLAGMLKDNKNLQKLECEGNNLGVKAAEAIGEALKKNTCLRSLNLESNNLTASGNNQNGIIILANALRENKSLRVLMLSKNGITVQAGEHFVRAIEANDMLTLVDLSGNEQLSVKQLQRIDEAVQRNRKLQSEIRRSERRERFALYNEEFKCRQHSMQVEAMRLEIEALEERRLNRMKARFEKWVDEIRDAENEQAAKEEELLTEAADRAEANKNKGKKKRK